MTDTMLTAKEVQDLFDIDRSTVYRMASDGRLPAVRVGRQWRFPLASIRRMLTGESGADAPTPGGLGGHMIDSAIDVAADALGVMMVVTALDGRPLTRVANPCPRFMEMARDPRWVTECAEDWREFAADGDSGPVFRPGRHGFMCARSLVWKDGQPAAMVLAGGVALPDQPSDDVYELTPEQRRRVVSSLPKIASLVSDLLGDGWVPDTNPLSRRES